MILAIYGPHARINSSIIGRLKRDYFTDSVVIKIRFPIDKIATMFGWHGEQTQNSRKLKKNIYLIGIQYNPNVWGDKLKNTLDRIYYKRKTIIIEDLSDVNEALMLKAKNAIIICIGNVSDVISDMADIVIKEPEDIDAVYSEITQDLKRRDRYGHRCT